MNLPRLLATVLAFAVVLTWIGLGLGFGWWTDEAAMRAGEAMQPR